MPYVQTPMEIVERMLRMAEVGQGRPPHRPRLGRRAHRDRGGEARRDAASASTSTRNLVKHANERAREAGRRRPRALRGARHLRDRPVAGDAWSRSTCCRNSTPSCVPQLLKLKPGTRIVSHDGGIGDWPPDERLEMRAPEKPVGVGGVSRVELWIVPADARGSWTSQIPGHGGRVEVRDQAEVPGDGRRRRRAGQGPAGAQQPPARHRDQDRGHRHRRRARLPPLLRGPRSTASASPASSRFPTATTGGLILGRQQEPGSSRSSFSRSPTACCSPPA